MIAMSASGRRMDSGCSFLFVARRVDMWGASSVQVTLTDCSAFCNTGKSHTLRSKIGLLLILLPPTLFEQPNEIFAGDVQLPGSGYHLHQLRFHLPQALRNRLLRTP